MHSLFRTLTKAAIGCTASAVGAGSILLRDKPHRWCTFSDADADANSPKSEEEFQPRYPLVPEEEETEEEKQYWKEKRHCSFCSIFLDSPCRQEFKSWSMCVDRCKSEADAEKASRKKESVEEGNDVSESESSEESEGCDFASHCADSTMALFTCQAANEAYFEPFMKAEEELKKKREEEENAEKEVSRVSTAIENNGTEVDIVEKVGDDGSVNVEIKISVEDEEEEEVQTKPIDTTSKYIVTSIDAMPEVNPNKKNENEA